ncbi:MAG TPA: tail fiber domain-containing protein [Ferruginibacter sp.]|nr:tail fiber domain-containing protein [Ferruginibacter sp.]
MKKICFFFFLLATAVTLSAQNIGIGTTEPLNKLQVQGSILVTSPTTATTTAPTAAQTKTLPGLGTITFLNTDSTGRLYDPGGPAGNYGIDLDSKANILPTSNIGFEVIFETMDLNTGDSLIIKESSTGTKLIAVGNGYNTTGKWIFNSSSLYINFKSNTDFNTGAGFSLLFRRLYNNSFTLPDVSGHAGNTFFFDAKSGALRSGELNNSARGTHSVALGFNNTASSNSSIALGSGTIASGFNSIAMGQNTIASGAFSTAMGSVTTAIGINSTAMGYQTIASGSSATATGQSTDASGDFSMAMGHLTNASGTYSLATGKSTDATGHAATATGDNSLASGAVSFASGFHTTASGNYSTAMGSYVSTNNYDGSFIIGDNSTTTVLNSANINNFRARFAGGYRLFTSAAAINAESCLLAAGGNAWVTASDVRLKEKFQQSDGENFLEKIATMKLGSWNYISQNPLKQRHYGPMAQDFYAAFGKDKYGTIGNDTTINSADFAGVSFIAIQALEKRTQKMEALEKENANLLARLKEFEINMKLQQTLVETQQKQLYELMATVKKMLQDNTSH